MVFKRHMTHESWRERLAGQSPAMERIVATIRLVARRRSTVLITGETGTGKEVAAQAIHEASPRAAAAFVAVNCAAIPANLLESELFGHVRGAFTGASGNRSGHFEIAHRGTLFLDEVGDLPLELQAKLLRVLQEREFRRVGSSATLRVDVRLIAATNINLEEHVRSGRFREDLFYRLNVVPLTLPPLRNRREDIPLLVEHFLKKICTQECVAVKEVAPEALRHLMLQDWPGNVRQLENTIEMAVAFSGDHPVLELRDFLQAATSPDQAEKISALPENGLDFDRYIGSIELNLLNQALVRANGNKTQAAEFLNLNRTTLAAKLKSLSATASE